MLVTKNRPLCSSKFWQFFECSICKTLCTEFKATTRGLRHNNLPWLVALINEDLHDGVGISLGTPVGGLNVVLGTPNRK